MSRTNRNGTKADFYPYRYPKTFNERKQLNTLLYDDEVVLRNRDKAKITNLPTVYDDIVISGYREDYTWKHHFDR
jgi:hypothetical protein